MLPKDKLIQADIGIFRALFPEQTRSVYSIIVWSIILLLDIIALAGIAVSQGWTGVFSKTGILLLLAAVILLFWLEGFLWGAVRKLIQK